MGLFTPYPLFKTCAASKRYTRLQGNSKGTPARSTTGPAPPYVTHKVCDDNDRLRQDRREDCRMDSFARWESRLIAPPLSPSTFIVPSDGKVYGRPITLVGCHVENVARGTILVQDATRGMSPSVLLVIACYIEGIPPRHSAHKSRHLWWCISVVLFHNVPFFDEKDLNKECKWGNFSMLTLPPTLCVPHYT